MGFLEAKSKNKNQLHDVLWSGVCVVSHPAKGLRSGLSWYEDDKAHVVVTRTGLIPVWQTGRRCNSSWAFLFRVSLYFFIMKQCCLLNKQFVLFCNGLFCQKCLFKREKKKSHRCRRCTTFASSCLIGNTQCTFNVAVCRCVERFSLGSCEAVKSSCSLLEAMWKPLCLGSEEKVWTLIYSPLDDRLIKIQWLEALAVLTNSSCHIFFFSASALQCVGALGTAKT